MAELDQIKPAIIEKGSKSYLFYGTFSTGKTTFALEHPGKKFVIDVDDKMREMENLHPRHLENTTVWALKELLVPGGIKMPIVDPTRKDPKVGVLTGEAPKGYKRVEALTNELLILANKPDSFPYDVVILDSGTALCDHLIYAIQYAHKMGTMTETLWGIFGQAIAQYIGGLLRLRDHGCDVIVIFHERHVTKKDKEGHITEEFIRPSCPGGYGLNIGRSFSEIYYFTGRGYPDPKGNVKYFIQTAGDNLLPARTTKDLDFKQELDAKRIYGT